MSAVPAWFGIYCDHLIETCPHRMRARPQLERQGHWRQCIDTVDPDGTDLCGWCVRVWKSRNRREVTA
jgi:hypothetical protein